MNIKELRDRLSALGMEGQFSVRDVAQPEMRRITLLWSNRNPTATAGPPTSLNEEKYFTAAL